MNLVIMIFYVNYWESHCCAWNYKVREQCLEGKKAKIVNIGNTYYNACKNNSNDYNLGGKRQYFMNYFVNLRTTAVSTLPYLEKQGVQ